MYVCVYSCLPLLLWSIAAAPPLGRGGLFFINVNIRTVCFPLGHWPSVACRFCLFLLRPSLLLLFVSKNKLCQEYLFVGVHLFFCFSCCASVFFLISFLERTTLVGKLLLKIMMLAVTMRREAAICPLPLLNPFCGLQMLVRTSHSWYWVWSVRAVLSWDTDHRTPFFQGDRQG